MKTLLTILFSAFCFTVLGQKTVRSTLKLENIGFGECTAQSVPFKYSIKNYGPETFIFHASPSTPIDDLTFNVYLSQNETLETGTIGGINDVRIGSAVPAQYTLAVGDIAFNRISVPVNNPAYSSYRFVIVEVAYSSSSAMTATTLLAKKYRVSLGKVIFE